MIDCVASERQYVDHLAPIWFALDESERGMFFAIRGAADRCAQLGIPFHVSRPPHTGGYIIAASFQDMTAAKMRPVVFVEHGAGQTYTADPNVPPHGSYSGGPERDPVVLFLCPNEMVAEANLKSYPKARAEVVGCPKLDQWCDIQPKTFSGDVTVAISFHADLHLCPETRWAYPHYKDALPSLGERFKVLGHGHPRMYPLLEREYPPSFERVEHFSEVLERASLYISDSSSTLYEFAATGKPVLVLNAPWYRREVNHGLRFWDQIPGIECDSPVDLIWSVERALADSPMIALRRTLVVSEVYGPLDGKASERAVEAIRALG